MSTPAELDAASKCYCFNDDQFKRVVAYLLDQIAAGGGGSSQDMQVAWTPTNIKLGDEMGFVSDPTFGSTPVWPGVTSFTVQGTSVGFVDLESCISLITISAPLLTTFTPTLSSSYFSVQGNPVLQTIDLPSMVTFPATSNSMNNNPSLTTINLPLLVPSDGQNFLFNGNALSAATVNALLHRFVLQSTWGNAAETLDLSGGTNAAPSGTGIADKATLLGRGATLITN